MAFPSINGTNILDSMKSRGQYSFTPQDASRQSGDGTAIATGPQTITWIFSSLTKTELQFWTDTLLSDAFSVPITAAELWDDEFNEVTFTGGVLYRPVPERREGGLFWNVEVRMDHMLPLL